MLLHPFSGVISQTVPPFHTSPISVKSANSDISVSAYSAHSAYSAKTCTFNFSLLDVQATLCNTINYSLMARQVGIIRLTGGVGNLSFYKSQDGYLVRKKSGVSRERIMSDPAYARTRENIAEFRRGALATKLLRRAFSTCLRTAADNRVTSRLTSVIMKVIKTDAINPRGERSVTNGEVALLEGFEFNKNAGLAKTFSAPFTAATDRATGTMTIDIPSFSPANSICAPEGATHFRLKAVGAAIDFGGNTCSIATSETADLLITEDVQGPLLLSHTVARASTNPLFLAFGVEFLQLVNGVLYPLTNATINAMTIVRVDGSRFAEVNINREDAEERKITPSSSRSHSRANLTSEGQRVTLPSRMNKPVEAQSLGRLPGVLVPRCRLPDAGLRRRFLFFQRCLS